MGLFSSIPAPTLTEKTLSDQQGKVRHCLGQKLDRYILIFRAAFKVFIVTGSTSGVGRELAEILYMHNARVYPLKKQKRQ